MKILAANAGSTSLKFKLYDMPQETALCSGKVERVGGDGAFFSYTNLQTGKTENLEKCSVPTYTEGIGLFLRAMCGPENGVIDDVRVIEAVGFKTVAAKGFYGVHRIDEAVMQAMRDYLPVAPAHNTAYIEAIGCFREVLPSVPFVGVFETAFHQTIPPHRYIYSIPYEWSEKYGIRRLGFHGASHSYSASVLAMLFGAEGKAVTCHLGGSGSICAVENGKSVDTSFGMSLQTGLPQNNRTGDLDPYIIRYLLAQGLGEEEIFSALASESGLLGVSGAGRDLRDITAAAEAGNARARLAIDQFRDSVLHYIGAYAAEMGGIDRIAFTGGIGERAASFRWSILEKLAFLGVLADPEANENASRQSDEEAVKVLLAAGADPAGAMNAAARGVRLLTRPESKVSALMIPADEEIVVSRKTYACITG